MDGDILADKQVEDITPLAPDSDENDEKREMMLEIKLLKSELSYLQKRLIKIEKWKNINQKLFDEKETKLTEYIFQINAYSTGVFALIFAVIIAISGVFSTMDKWVFSLGLALITLSFVLFSLSTYIIVRSKKEKKTDAPIH